MLSTSKLLCLLESSRYEEGKLCHPFVNDASGGSLFTKRQAMWFMPVRTGMYSILRLSYGKQPQIFSSNQSAERHNWSSRMNGPNFPRNPGPIISGLHPRTMWGIKATLSYRRASSNLRPPPPLRKVGSTASKRISPLHGLGSLHKGRLAFHERVCRAFPG